ncbi:putative No apical meristem-associated domain-containing protein [Helianthus anomalus]
MTEQDKFDKAKIMYQSEEKCNFLFEHCWNLLKDQPKWILRDAAKQRKTMVPPPTPTTTPTTTPSPTRNVIEDEVVELDRPMGKKAAVKKRKVEGKQTEEIIQLRKMKFTLLEEAQAQEKEYFRLKTEKMEYDKKVEDERLRLLSEKLRIEAEKTELAKLQLMFLDVWTQFHRKSSVSVIPVA